MNQQREGWIGEDYVRVYATSDLGRLLQLYDFLAYLPGYQLIGSWGLDALCLGADGRFYLIDWIPLQAVFRRERYSSTAAFEKDLTQLHPATADYEFFEKEVHFVTPLVFGGSPKASPVMLDQTAHAEACRFWNQTYAKLEKEPNQAT